MFRNIFRPDSPLMVTMSQITDCIFLSLFWILGCFPVVTAGASVAAMYDAVSRGFRQGEKNSWQCFLRAFRRNWKDGILPTVVFLAAMWAIVTLMVKLWNSAVYGTVSWGVFSGGAFVGVVLVGVLSVVFPMLSRFENSTGALLRNAVLVALANLPRTLCLGLLNTVCGLFCVRYVFPLFFLPALAALIGTMFLEPMFKPYLPKDAAE